MSRQRFTAEFERSDGWWVASIKEWPGVASQGKTLASALSNLADAVRVSIEDIPQEED